jgi:hypothetical protein
VFSDFLFYCMNPIARRARGGRGNRAGTPVFLSPPLLLFPSCPSSLSFPFPPSHHVRKPGKRHKKTRTANRQGKGKATETCAQPKKEKPANNRQPARNQKEKRNGNRKKNEGRKEREKPQVKPMIYEG